MSRAISVYHGRFGRATLYELNRPMTTHAHREGHLIFYVRGAPGGVRVCGRAHGLYEHGAVAVSSWEPHAFIPGDTRGGGLFLVLYVNPIWFATPGQLASAVVDFGTNRLDVDPRIEALVDDMVGLLENCEAPALFDDTLFELVSACHDASWAAADRGRRVLGPVSAHVDFRVRKSMQLMSEALGSEIVLDAVARDSGLSRPHFYKLFRRQTGLTPNLFLNTLRMERAIQWLTETGRSITDIGYELGFSCQSVFTRFFSSHVGMAPTDYRRAVQILRG